MRGAPANFDLKAEIAAYWDGRADTFDASPNHPIQPGVEEVAWQALLRHHLPRVPEPRVLELGCGTGIVTLQLVKAGARVTALDLGARMLELARAKAKAAGIDVEFIYGDAEDPFVAGNGFDAVVCRHLVWTLPNPADAISRWRSALRPDGKVLVIDNYMKRDGLRFRLTHALANWLERGSTLHPTTRDADSPYSRLQAKLPFGINGVPASSLAKLLTEAGYQSIDIDPMNGVREARRLASTFPQRLRMAGSRRFLLSATSPGGGRLTIG